MEKIYWDVTAINLNEERRNTFSPLFDSTKDVELWRMKFIIENPDDHITFSLRKENGKPYTTGIGCLVTEVWAGHELSC